MRLALCLTALTVASQSLALQEQVLTEGLGITIPGQRRTMLRQDPIEDLLTSGKWKEPKAGDKVGNSAWKELKADKENSFGGPEASSGYIAMTVNSAEAKTVLLEAGGCSMVYVNGAPRAGDIYGFGYGSFPIKLAAGKNSLLFAQGRGFLRAKLVTPPAPISLDPRDLTAPDLLVGEKGKGWAALIVRNATDSWAKDLTIEAKPAKGGKAVRTKLGGVLPMGVRKVGFELDMSAPEGAYVVRLLRGGKELHRTEIKLRVVDAGQAHKRTFVSRIDGTVQYYAQLLAQEKGEGKALFLSLHGASVEAIGQAQAYGPKTWGHLVAPTNRRPFGFNWEDIGRKDALEVLELAQKSLKPNPQKTYLTGHSMGGHGTWHLASLYPDRFAVAAPSAGWVSYWSYAGGAEYDMSNPIQEGLRRASNASDTLKLTRNLAGMGIFIIHGDADDNVPVREARTMREALSPFHKDLYWHEEPGQGHWFDTDPEPGANCVDFRPAFDLFAKRRIPEKSAVSTVEFVCVSPRINGRSWWAEVVTQETPFAYSTIKITRNPGQRSFVGTTENVRRLNLEPVGMASGGRVSVELDGQKVLVSWPREGPLKLIKEGGKWSSEEKVDQALVAAQGTWSFKDVFDSKVVFVVGTQGDANSNARLLQKASYDAEMFWIIGNGSPEVILDKDWKPELTKGRNVLLYGRSDQNSAWKSLLSDSQIQPGPGFIQDGRSRMNGSFCVLLSMPKPGEPSLLVGAICGTDEAGDRKAIRVPIFTAGAGIGPSLILPSDGIAK